MSASPRHDGDTSPPLRLGDVTASRWPAWFGPAGFVTAFLTVTVLATALTLIAESVGVVDVHSTSPHWVVLLTVVQDLVFIGTAVAFAARSGSVSARTFGLTPVSLARAVPYVIGALVLFMVMSATWAALIGVPGDQDVLESFGAQEGSFALVRAGLLVVVLAPVAEEVLFRGFIYRALRNRFSVAVASGGVGAVFAAVHYSGPETLPLLPPIALLSVLFCLLYERTGSLWPAIALHAINNAIALGATGGRAEAPTVALVLAGLALALCAVGARQPRSLRASGHGQV